MINIKRASNTCALPPLPQQASFLMANPFGKSAIAFVNGHTCIIPMRTVKVTFKRPRTQFVLASQYELLTQGY